MTSNLVKFYSFLVEKGHISAEQLDRMRNTIRSEISRYND